MRQNGAKKILQIYLPGVLHNSMTVLSWVYRKKPLPQPRGAAQPKKGTDKMARYHYVTTGLRGKPVPRVETVRGKDAKPRGKILAGPLRSLAAANVLASPAINNPQAWSEESARQLAIATVGAENVRALDAE